MLNEETMALINDLKGQCTFESGFKLGTLMAILSTDPDRDIDMIHHWIDEAWEELVNPS